MDSRPRRNWWKDEYRPLRIVARMASALSILPHEGLPLDGILEFAAFRLGWPPVLQYADPVTGRHHLPRVTDRDPANFILPVKRDGHKTAPDWFWCASWAAFPQGAELDRTHWNRRFDGGDAMLGRHLNFGGRTQKVSVKSGRYKGYHMPLALIVAPVVEWHCFAAADGVAKLLQAITHLGKKRSYGHGEILRWEIHAARDDWSCWRDCRPTRALPDQDGDYHRAEIGLRPPYWHPSRRRLCIVPAAAPLSTPAATTG